MRIVPLRRRSGGRREGSPERGCVTHSTTSGIAETDDDSSTRSNEEEEMARVLITGSSDGLGLMAAELLAHVGHAVTLHARNDQRAGDARRALSTAEHVVVGDLASIEETRQVAEQANALGSYDAVIHNAGVGYREPRRSRDRRRTLARLRGQRLGPIPADRPDRSA